MKIPTLLLYLFPLSITVIIQGCNTFSDLQSARMVGDGRTEITPFVSRVSTPYHELNTLTDTEIGLQAIYGLSKKLDVGARASVLWIEGSDYSDFSFQYGLGPKLSILENRIALAVPFTTDFSYWRFQPTLFLTTPVIPDKVDITLNPKYIINPCRNCENYFALNLGLALSSNLSEWALRLEYGQLYGYGNQGYVSQMSMGLSKTFGKEE